MQFGELGNLSANRDGAGAKIYNYQNSGSSNRLQSVSGLTVQDYEYDANGNTTKDGLNGISLTYNYLNLPATAVRTTGTPVNLSYIYDATGNKLAKSSNGLVRNYVDGVEYRPDGTIVIIHTEEGTARNSGGNYSYEYNLSDHLGNVRATFYKNPNTNLLEVLQRDDYYAFGLRKVARDGTNKYLYNGKELQEELGQYDYGARFYDPVIGRWNSVDPLAEKMKIHSPYNYGFNNPIRFVDPDGREPIPSQAGIILGFIKFLNNTRSKMGTLTGSAGHDAMMRLGKTEMNWAHLRPEPMTTNPFNTSKDKYIYTTKGGWLDMAHFMFYAGKAYDYKQQKESAQNAISEISKAGGYAGMGMSADLTKTANINPVGEAVQDGYRQEMSDRFVAEHSAYSYEDLPSDKLGAEFGANYYNPNSKLSLGEQLLNYVNSLGATDPKNAPNYKKLPKDDSKLDSPTKTNHTTKPMYTQ